MVDSTHCAAAGNGYFTKFKERMRAGDCNGPRDKAGDADVMSC